MSCPLCATVATSENPLFIGANASAAAVLHEDWAVRGHAMIVAKRHVENVSHLSSPEREAFFDLLTRVEAALSDVLDAPRVLGLKLGLAVPHLHHHLYPVKTTFTRDDFFMALELRSRDEPAEKEKRQIVDRLRRRLTD